MARHPFNFEDGEYLTTMGAVWFVSYCYYNKIDKIHLNWQNISTVSNRMSVYRRTADFHKFWLHRVLEMNDRNLNKNTLGLSGDEVKNMAKKLLTTV